MADTEHETPPFVMGPEEAKRWHDYEVDRRNGVSTVGSLRHVTGTTWEPGR